MEKRQGSGSSASQPILVTSCRETPPLLSDLTDLSSSYCFSDFKLAKENEACPASDLFDRFSQVPELHISLGAYPEWNKTRPYLTGKQLWTDPPSEPVNRKINDSELIDDLLGVLMGFGGEYLQPVFSKRHEHHQDVHFELKASVDGSTNALLRRLMPICEAIVVVQRFVETRSGMEYGTVCHAVAAAMQAIMDDWMLLVTQLESQLRAHKLSLQSLWFYVQPAMSVMLLIADICRQTAAHDLQGTELLNLLYSRMKQMSGSANSEALLRKLLEAATVPYFEILEKWICEGVIHDPYAEFMIEEDSSVSTTKTTPDLQSAYWQNRYQIRKTFLSLKDSLVTVNCVPTFLQQHSEVILKTGKYLNAIRECGRHVERPLDSDEHPVYDSTCSYVRLIQKAHKAASQSFLDMFVKDLRLIDLIRALKHFFLMDKGDMVGHLMDIAEEELQKVASHVVVNRMQSLLELAFKTSSLPCDINTEPLSVELDHRSFVDLSVCLRQPQRQARASVRSRQSVAFQAARTSDATRASFLAEELTGWDILMIGYRIEWPMTLIVSPKQMQIYQLIFKQLFTLKRTEFELCKAWKALQTARILTDKSLDGIVRLAETTCYQMQHLVQQYLRHLTVYTIEPRWIAMEAALSKAKDVDEVIHIHQHFLDKVNCPVDYHVSEICGQVLWQSFLKKVKGVKELDNVISDSLSYAHFISSSLGFDMTPVSDRVSQEHSEAASERRRLLGVKIDAALKSNNFDQRVMKYRADYLSKVNQLVKTLMDYCDMESGDKAQEELQTREDLDKLINLIEMIKPV